MLGVGRYSPAGAIFCTVVRDAIRKHVSNGRVSDPLV
jgi:hypothetical protein